MEIKEEFYQIMTLASAYIYHNVLGLSFVIEDTTKTLTVTDIERIMGNIAAALAKATGAQVRA